MFIYIYIYIFFILATYKPPIFTYCFGHSLFLPTWLLQMLFFDDPLRSGSFTNGTPGPLSAGAGATGRPGSR